MLSAILLECVLTFYWHFQVVSIQNLGAPSIMAALQRYPGIHQLGWTTECSGRYLPCQQHCKGLCTRSQWYLPGQIQHGNTLCTPDVGATVLGVAGIVVTSLFHRRSLMRAAKKELFTKDEAQKVEKVENFEISRQVGVLKSVGFFDPLGIATSDLASFFQEQLVFLLMFLSFFLILPSGSGWFFPLRKFNMEKTWKKSGSSEISNSETSMASGFQPFIFGAPHILESCSKVLEHTLPRINSKRPWKLVLGKLPLKKLLPFRGKLLDFAALSTTWMCQEVSNWLGSVCSNPKEYPIYKDRWNNPLIRSPLIHPLPGPGTLSKPEVIFGNQPEVLLQGSVFHRIEVVWALPLASIVNLNPATWGRINMGEWQGWAFLQKWW